MKKLKLKALGLGAKEILTREGLKKLMGGFEPGTSVCNTHCADRGVIYECYFEFYAGQDHCTCPVQGNFVTPCR